MFLVRFNTEHEYESESQLSTGLTISQGTLGESVKLTPLGIALNFSNLIENIGSKRVVNRLGYQLLKHDLSAYRPFRNPEFDKDFNRPDSIAILQILDTLDRAIINFELINKSTSTGRLIDELIEKYQYTEFDIWANSSVYRKGNSDFINIRFTCENARLAAHVVNTWAKSFIDYNNLTNASRMSGSLAALRQIKNQREDRLNQALDKLNRFRSSNAIVNSQTESVNQQLNDYKRAISDEESNARRIQLTLDNLREQITSQANNSPANIQNEIALLNRKINRLSDELINDPDNNNIKRDLDLARADLQDAMYKYNSSSNTGLDELFEEENDLELELSVSLEKISRLNDDYRSARSDVRSITSKTSTLEVLEAEVTSTREEYLKAEQEYSNAVSESTIGLSSLRLSYPGEIPEEPKSRKTIMFTGLGFGFGLAITLFLIISLEFLDNRIKSPTKFKRVIGHDPIAVVRHFKNCKATFAGIIKGEFKGLSLLESEFFLNNLRKIRFEFQSLTQKVFLFTSLRKGSGKSFLMSSIAYSLSLIDKRVLIIDTNFRDNWISRSYSVFMKENNIKDSGFDRLIANHSRQKRLADKSGKQHVSEALITKTVNTNIDLIISQNINMTPSEIFSKVKFGLIIKELSNSYDFIFMEGAELNNYSDSKELSKYSDFIVPIYSIEDKIESIDRASNKFLENNQIDMKIMLNNVRPEDIE